jgi:hypothetical protein
MEGDTISERGRGMQSEGERRVDAREIEGGGGVMIIGNFAKMCSQSIFFQAIKLNNSQE